MNSESMIPESIIPNEELCFRCNTFCYTHIRVFDYRLLPKEYFYRPNDKTLAILKEQGIFEMDTYPDHWVHLPKKYILTKYPYKVCENCYNLIKDVPLQAWNKWIEYK